MSVRDDVAAVHNALVAAQADDDTFEALMRLVALAIGNGEESEPDDTES